MILAIGLGIRGIAAMHRTHRRCHGNDGYGWYGPWDDDGHAAHGPSRSGRRGRRRGRYDDAGVASRAVLAQGRDFPATVAVTEAGAWTCEAQTDHLLGLDPNPPTTPFKVVRIPL